MTIQLTRPATALDEQRAVVADVRSCSCGQELDCCHAAHCPRCGVSIKRH